MKNRDSKWYVLFGDQKKGPYDFKTIIQMIQSHQLMDFNYVWSEHLDSWTPIYMLEEFSKKNFDQILNSNSEFSSYFIKRKSPRIEIKVPVTGHNTIRFFDGETISVSKNGALCLLNSSLIEVGDHLKLRLISQESSDNSFNVEASVLRKNHSQDKKQSQTGLYYAVRFDEIQEGGIQEISKWISILKAS